jgi:hypothetical protein
LELESSTSPTTKSYTYVNTVTATKAFSRELPGIQLCLSGALQTSMNVAVNVPDGGWMSTFRLKKASHRRPQFYRGEPSAKSFRNLQGEVYRMTTMFTTPFAESSVLGRKQSP